MNLRERLNSAPLPIYGIVVGLLFAVLTIIIDVGVSGVKLSAAELIGHAVGGVLFGIVMTLFASRQRRRAGGVAVGQQVRTALKAGSASPEVDTAGWNAILERRRNSNRLAIWLNPIVFGLAAVLSLWLIFAYGWVYVLFAVFFVAIGVWSTIACRRELTRISVLQSNLGITA